uniref:Transcriptional regulator, TetR family n=1 Tax=Desulfovibrio desulfuricans (strain ATCC 27774 / DSM 6949 / MB) TaxID=525146 RepID=B8J299_DESDA
MSNTVKTDGKAPVTAIPSEHSPFVADQGRQTRNAAQTRQRILLAARGLFANNNYESVGTREIAAKAGVNATLINRYFGSKKKLFVAVVESLSELIPPRDVEDDVADLLDQALNSIVHEGEHSQWLDEFRIILFSALDQEVSDIIADFFEKRRKGLARRLTGPGAAARADAVFSLLTGAAIVVSLLRGNQKNDLDQKEFRKKLGQVLVPLLAAG